MLSFLGRTPSTASLLSPTIFELEPNHYAQAKSRSDKQAENEQTQWQNYLHALGHLAFQAWLSESNLSASNSTESSAEPALILAPDGRHIYQIGEFRLSLWVSEHTLSEQINIPLPAIHHPAEAAHFYVLLEVDEEQSEVWFRGLIRRDQLLQGLQNHAFPFNSETATIPLAALEPEPSRLLHYCRYLEPSAIPLPQAAASTSTTPAAITTIRTQLSQWIDSIAETISPGGWQPWELLQPQLAYATRGLADGLRRGKLVNLGLEIEAQPVALVLTLTPETDERISVLVQLLPTGSDRTLPPNMSLSLISKKGKQIQQVTSRAQDSYIQLKSFKGSVGQRFSIQITFQNASISEEFEI